MEEGLLGSTKGNNFRVTEVEIPFYALSNFGRSRFAPGRCYYQFSLAFVSDLTQCAIMNSEISVSSNVGQ